MRITLLYTLFCLLLHCTITAQTKTSEDAERERSIAASQSGASPLFFYPAVKGVPLAIPDSFHDAKEFTLRKGLPNFFHKVRAGKPVTIGYIGGSITQAMYCYRTKLAAYIQGMYPAVTMKGINAGVSGTGTDLGACRLYDQLLQYHPDLVFVEFAVNGAYAPGMEGIVRQIWKNNPNTDICFIYTIYTGQTKVYAAGRVPENIQGLDKIAAHYNIPAVHMGLEAAMLEKAGKLVWKGDSASAPSTIVFSKDGTHPVEAGGNLYAAAVARAMRAMKEVAAPVKHELPAPLIEGNWEDAAMYAPLQLATFSKGWRKVNTREDGALKQFAGWFPYVMKAAQPGESFTFRFRGTLFGFFDIGGPEVGQLQVTIDGKPVKLKTIATSGTRLVQANFQEGSDVINRFNNYCNNRYRGQYECIEVTSGEHTVTIHLSAQKADKVAILGKNQLADITANPGKYDSTVIYIGKILLRGEMIP
jgi:lysophospholipase L1-like esterase